MICKNPVSCFKYVDDLWVRRLAVARHERVLWYVGADYSVEYIYKGERRTFTVPAGTATDFASIPGVIRVLIPKVGPHAEAAVVHDYGYTGALSKDDADWIFLAGLAEARVGFIKRWAMYLAVRWFGGQAYRRGGHPAAMEEMGCSCGAQRGGVAAE